MFGPRETVIVAESKNLITAKTDSGNASTQEKGFQQADNQILCLVT
jgi:hypothetical protein